MDSLQEEMNDLKKQVKEDFQFSMIAMARVTEHMNEVTRELGHLQGKMARQEERFELMVDVMQRMMNQVNSQHQAKQEEVEGKLTQVFQRLDRLEQDHSSAA